jgi:GAF domain-containing protein
MLSQLAVPMRRKGKVIGALNLLSETTGAFTSQDEALLRQFAAHVAVAIENARLVQVGTAVRRHARDARGNRP